MQAIILAGGKGTRLAERLAGRPKPLIDVCGIPLLERQIRTLESNGVNDVIVLVNHAADQIRRFFETHRFDATVRIVDDGEPRGTAGAVLACLNIMAPRALVIYGDTLFDVDVQHMIAAHDRAAADATLLLHPNDHPADSDLVAIDADGYVSAFHPHPRAADCDLRNLVNAAFYVVERDALVRWHDAVVPSDFGHDLFPTMIAAGQRLFGYVSFEYIKDLGTPSRLDKAERHLETGFVARASRRIAQPAVFIDRDGTLNKLAGHISAPEAIELLPGSGAAVRRLNDAGRRTVLVTNQPVVARGECDLATLDRIHGRLEMLLSSAGGYLDRIYFCPHHPDAGFPGEVAALKFACVCRKPRSGMIEAAIEELHIDRYRSWMVGDSSADMGAANEAGILSICVETGEGGRDGRATGTANVSLPDFAAAVDFIINRYPKLAGEAADRAAHITAGDLILVDETVTPGFAAVLCNELRAAGRIVAMSSKAGELADEESEIDGTTRGKDAVLVVDWPSRSPPPPTRRTVHRISSPEASENTRRDH